MEMHEDIYLGERNAQEAEALKCLIDAESYLGEAMLNDSVELYSKALEFSKKVLVYFPRCVIAHYIAAVSHLKAKGDKNYAKHRYEFLQSIKSDDADALATRLKDEIERTKGISVTG